MAFDFGNFISGLNQKARRAMPTATRRAYAPALNPGTIFSSAKPPVTVPGAILGLTGKATERIMLPVAIYEQGRQVFNPQDNILTRIGDLGSGIRNLASGRPYLEGRTSSVQRPPMPGLPADYKQTELAAGAAAERFRPGAGFPGQQAAADRAYESEKARVSQLTAQDPELKRYEEASKKAKTQEEMNAARDIGMAIWARTYGPGSKNNLAAKVKPGQSGYEVIQNELGAGQVGPVKDLPFDATKPLSPTPIPPEQRNVTYQGINPIPIPGADPVVPVAFGTPQTQMFETFRQAIAPGPNFQGSPLGTTPQTAIPTYGAQLGNPLGTPVSDESFRSEKAKQLAQMFMNAQMGR